MIEIKQLKKSFGEKKVLHDITVTFTSGRTYGVVGSNGAGKTTLFRCIAGLESYEGTILSDHMPLKDRLGYLVAEQYFLPRITGEEYIILLTEARGHKIHDVLSRNIFNLPLGAYVSTYSSGMKKKLAIMAILLQRNDYFIFDEPYNGLDLQSSIVLTEIIHRLKTKGKIVLISSHIFSTLMDTCDEILVLENGTFNQCVERRDFLSLENELKENILNIDLDKIF